MSSRDNFFENVAPAMRVAIARTLEDTGLTLRECRVLLAGLHNLATYSRMSEDVYLDYIVELARLDRRHVRRALAANNARGALLWLPGEHRRKRSWWGLPGADPRRPLVGQVPNKRGADSNEKGGPNQTQNVSGSAPLPRSNREGETEKTATAAVEQIHLHKLDRLLRPFGLHASQRELVDECYLEDRDGTIACVREALAGKRPAALLTSMLRAGEHRRSRAEAVPYTQAESWIRNTGWQVTVDDARDLLADLFGVHDADDVARLLEIRALVRQERAA